MDMNLPDFCSWFQQPNCIFGKYLTQQEVTLLETQYNVNVFVDLTCASEITPSLKYKVSTTSTYISFPIADKRVPSNIQEFKDLLNTIKELLANPNTVIYTHCLGGHGRSGLFVASYYKYIGNMPSDEALALTKCNHAKRKTMDAKWRKMGSPQTNSQKQFVKSF
jgi:protein-tyrosine phosphatase